MVRSPETSTPRGYHRVKEVKRLSFNHPFPHFRNINRDAVRGQPRQCFLLLRCQHAQRKMRRTKALALRQRRELLEEECSLSQAQPTVCFALTCPKTRPPSSGGWIGSSPTASR